MNGRERGFLLLTSHLGDPERRVLTTAQLRNLAVRMRTAQIDREDRELSEQDLLDLDYSREAARQILLLLSQEQLLDSYLAQGRARGCIPLTRVSAGYPALVHRRLGADAPGCLWARGDLRILDTPMISLVGCRELAEPNRQFARRAGMLAGERGITLVSGNARGADRTAQDACLEAGGRVVSIVADRLDRYPERGHLYLSEEDFDEPFSAARALSRNRCIHTLGRMVLVAQSELYKGGTWSGTMKNLRFGWSPVVCFDDGSPAVKALLQMGAYALKTEELDNYLENPEKI